MSDKVDFVDPEYLEKLEARVKELEGRIAELEQVLREIDQDPSQIILTDAQRKILEKGTGE